MKKYFIIVILLCLSLAVIGCTDTSQNKKADETLTDNTKSDDTSKKDVTSLDNKAQGSDNTKTETESAPYEDSSSRELTPEEFDRIKNDVILFVKHVKDKNLDEYNKLMSNGEPSSRISEATMKSYSHVLELCGDMVDIEDIKKQATYYQSDGMSDVFGVTVRSLKGKFYVYMVKHSNKNEYELASFSPIGSPELIRSEYPAQGKLVDKVITLIEAKSWDELKSMLVDKTKAELDDMKDYYNHLSEIMDATGKRISLTPRVAYRDKAEGAVAELVDGYYFAYDFIAEYENDKIIYSMVTDEEGKVVTFNVYSKNFY